MQIHFFMRRVPAAKPHSRHGRRLRQRSKHVRFQSSRWPPTTSPLSSSLNCRQPQAGLSPNVFGSTSANSFTRSSPPFPAAKLRRSARKSNAGVKLQRPLRTFSKTAPSSPLRFLQKPSRTPRLASGGYRRSEANPCANWSMLWLKALLRGQTVWSSATLHSALTAKSTPNVLRYCCFLRPFRASSTEAYSVGRHSKDRPTSLKQRLPAARSTNSTAKSCRQQAKRWPACSSPSLWATPIPGGRF